MENVLPKNTNPPTENKYYLSICITIKNEGPYLIEWIEFHRLVGVEHFYIYDNNSTDETKEVLKEYIQKGLVTYTAWPTNEDQQVKAYKHWITNFINETYWVAVIDLDEFLFGTCEQDLKKILVDYENYPGLSVNCVMFSNSNHFYTPQGLVIDNYTLRPVDSSYLHNCIKSIHNTKFISTSSKLNPHFFTYNENRSAVNENFHEIIPDEKPPFGVHSKEVSFNKIRVNHYKVKSVQNSVKKSSQCTTWLPEYKNYIRRNLELNSEKQITDLLLANKFKEYLQNSKEKDALLEKFKSINKRDITLQKKIFMEDLNKLYPIFPTEAVTLLWQSRNVLVNLKSPIDFNDKILWITINIPHKVMNDCADKYDCRAFVSNMGCFEILPKIFGLYNDVDELIKDFDQLPESFVIKGTVGCGQTILCENKKDFDLSKHETQIKNWLSSDYSRHNLEKYYTHKPRIICEEYLRQEPGVKFPFDYKVFCFNGKARLIMLCTGRSTPNEKHYYFDTNWNRLDILKHENLDNNPKKPEQLKKLIYYAEKLSSPFVHVRADFYIIQNKVVFGELTFLSAAGHIPDIKQEFLTQLGKGLMLPENIEIWKNADINTLINENKKLLKLVESNPSLYDAFNLPTLSHNYLSVCAILKNEALYIIEWIEFHRLVGVEHFYIYDNNSTDNILALLQPYIQKGIVTYTFWPPHPGQIKAYNHCLTNHGKRSKWIAFLDLDEFLFPSDKKESDLKKMLKSYEKFPGVGVNWICFGSNNQKTYDPKPVIERFTRRSLIDFSPNRHVKLIVQPQLTELSVNSPHEFIYKDHALAVNENFIPIKEKEPILSKVSVNKFRINHYLVKSTEEGLIKIKRGRTNSKDPRKIEYIKNHDKNDEEDTTILRFLPALKKVLQSNLELTAPEKKHFNEHLHKLRKSLSHKLQTGIVLAKSKCTPQYFDWKFYVEYYPDLQRAGINTEQKAIKHWVEYGAKEGRACSKLILHKKIEPKIDGFNTKEKIIKHYLNLGKQEKIYPNKQAELNSKKDKWYLSICTTFKDCAPYLKEWIEYHKLVGVEHFYMYNNYSSDNYREVLEPYVLDGTVELVDWNFDATKYSENFGHNKKVVDSLAFIQKHANNDCLLYRARNKTKWIALIDSDEFLVPIKENDLKETLRDYESYGGLVVNWRVFGTSNVKKLGPSDLLIEKLIYSQPENAPINQYIKSIVQPDKFLFSGDSHYGIYKDGFYAVNSNKQKHEEGGKTSNPVFDRIVINHYFYRTEEFFINVKSAQRKGAINKLNSSDFKLANSFYNPSILRFVPELRKIIFSKHTEKK